MDFLYIERAFTNYNTILSTTFQRSNPHPRPHPPITHLSREGPRGVCRIEQGCSDCNSSSDELKPHVFWRASLLTPKRTRSRHSGDLGRPLKFASIASLPVHCATLPPGMLGRNIHQMHHHLQRVVGFARPHWRSLHLSQTSELCCFHGDLLSTSRSLPAVHTPIQCLKWSDADSASLDGFPVALHR